MADSKVMYGTYTYSGTPRGDIGTALYDDSVPSITPHAGVVTTFGSPSQDIQPDPKPFYFENGAGNNRAAVASIVWNVGVATCTWLIYDADADDTSPFTWNAPIITQVPLTIGTTNITNPYRIVTRRIDGSTVDIYGIDYDAKIVFCVRSNGLNGDVYTMQPWSFTFPAPFIPAKPTTPVTPAVYYEAFGVDLEVTANGVYALFINGTDLSQGPPNAVYLNSTVVKLDFTLGSPVYMGPHNTTVTPGMVNWPAQNAFSIQAYGSDLVLTAVGGPQYYTTPITWNPDSRIQKVAQSNLAVTDLLKSAQSAGDPNEDKFDFRALSFSADGSVAYILTGDYDSGYTMHWNLFLTDMSTITGASNALISTAVGLPFDTGAEAAYYWGLLFSESTVKTWFAKGNNLEMYDSGGSVADAGGITALSTFTGPTDYPGLNFVTIYEGEVAPAPRTFKAYAAPAFASNSPAALLERERFFQEVAAAKAKK